MMNEYSNIYYQMLNDAKMQTKRFREEDVPPWQVIKSMIKREPNSRGLGIWVFIECAMIGWKLKEATHEDMPQEKRR